LWQGGRAALRFPEQGEIPVTAHAGRAEQVLDDENRHGFIRGNHQWSQNAGLGVNTMIAFLPAKSKPVLLE
jgi:hypothetical protein